MRSHAYRRLRKHSEAVDLAMQLYENDLVEYGEIWNVNDFGVTLKRICEGSDWRTIRTAMRLIQKVEA